MRATTILLALLLASPAFASVTLQNDSFVDGGTAVFQGGFAAGESGAVRLEPTGPFPIPLEKVQFLFGGAATSQTITLNVFQDTGAAAPGALIFTGDYLVTGSNTAMQEIDLTGQGVSITGPFRVSIQFQHSGYPSIARDDDGNIAATKNFIYANGIGWIQSNLLGLTGDWILRAVVGNPSPSSYTVGGDVSGATGGLTLQNNGGDDLILGGDGPFTFATPVADGNPYNVSVLTAPTGQNCVVLNGSGTVSGANVDDVQVICSDAGGPVVLQNDGFTPGANAGFQGGFVVGEIAASRFTPIGPAQLLAVQVLYGGGVGTRAVTLRVWDDSGGTDAPGVELYSQDFQLTGNDTVLQEMDISAAGIPVSADFRIGIEFQDDGLPSVARDDDGNIDPNRNFIYAGGLGWQKSSDLGLTGDWILRAVVSGGGGGGSFSIGGSVSGATGGLTLQNNGGDDLLLGGNGPFTFATPIADGNPYSVTVSSAPTGQNCVVLNGSGTVSGADVSNVQVICSDSGGPVVLQNDGFTPGANAGFQGGFAIGEIAASRFTPLEPAQLLAVRVLYGGAAGTRTVTLRVWDDSGGTDAPGVELYSQDFQLTGNDTTLQEMDVSAAGIPVSADFRVGIEFQDDGLPSVARDDDGNIDPDRNFLYASGLGWQKSSDLGVTGDWILRAVVSGGGGGDEPTILSIADVGNDQGRQVRLRFNASAQDSPASMQPVLQYEAYRRIDMLPLASDKLANWEFVGSIPSHGEAEYNMIAPTLADSTIADGMHFSVFFVRAATASPFTFYDSPPDSGYSLDNLAPGVPQGFTLAGDLLQWNAAPEADFAYWTVYGADSPLLDGGAAELGMTSTQAFDVSSYPYAYFLLTARDFSGNEGAPASTAGNVTAVEPPSLARAGVRVAPNPFNPATTIHFAVERSGPVRLTLFDARGRMVERLLDSAWLEAGEHRLDYRSQLASGVYLLQVETSGGSRSVKLGLVR